MLLDAGMMDYIPDWLTERASRAGRRHAGGSQGLPKLV
jgi:hypothetical protein